MHVVFVCPVPFLTDSAGNVVNGSYDFQYDAAQYDAAAQYYADLVEMSTPGDTPIDHGQI